MDIFAVFFSHPINLALTCLILGLIVGSFLNVVIYRLPIMMENEWQDQCCDLLEIDDKKPEELFNLAQPASSCPHCKHKIKPWENIPVVSFLFLKGRCSNCDAPIALRYPIIELLSGILSAFIALRVGYGIELLLVLILTWFLIALTMIDFDHKLLPDQLTLPLLWLGLIANSFELFASLDSAVWGAIAGYLSLWSLYWAFKLITGKDGMGYGDFKLFAAFGAWMGWQALPLIILLSSLVGAIVGVSLILFRGRDRNIPIPFGPFLAVAGWITLFWSGPILSAYYRLAGLPLN